MTERGRIRDPKLALIERDLSGLRWGAITPTDVDSFLDFGDRLFVFIECKFRGKELVGGQRLAFERLVDACHQPPRRASFGIVIEQAEHMPTLVDYAASHVRAIRANGKWLKPKAPIKCKEAIDRLIEKSKRSELRVVK